MASAFPSVPIELPGARISYTECGSGTPLVLLHSIPGSHLDYSEVMPELARDHRVIAMDWPGYGVEQDERYVPARATAASFSALFAQFIEKLALPPAIVIGNSMGGYAALRLALEHPERVRGVVLINSAGFTQSNWFTRTFIQIKGTELGTRALAHPLSKIYLRAKTPLVRQMQERARQVRFRPGQAATEAAIWRSFLDPATDIQARLPDLRAPVLILWGKHDIVLPWLTDGKLCASLLPQARVAVLPTGHSPQAEDPAAFLREVGAFLKTLKEN